MSDLADFEMIRMTRKLRIACMTYASLVLIDTARQEDGEPLEDKDKDDAVMALAVVAQRGHDFIEYARSRTN